MGVNGKNTEDSKNGKESGTGSPTNGQLSEESCSASDSESGQFIILFSGLVSYW